MRLYALAFLCGILILVTLKILPAMSWCFIFLLILPLLFLKNKWIKVGVWLVCGFLYALLRSHFLLDNQLPHSFEAKKILLTGYVVSIPTIDQQQTRFIFLANKIADQTANMKVRLSWRDNSVTLHPGDQWQLQVRLKRIHGLMNPGGSDYEAWAFLNGIHAHGYVVASNENHWLQHSWTVALLSQIRQFLKEKIESATSTSSSILALSVGERSDLTPAQWQIMRNTGTNHLFAIAGLHIGFVAGLFFLLINKIWRQFPRACLWYPAHQAGAIASLVAGILYGLLSGFSLPAMRACMMLSIFVLAIFLRRKLAAWQGFLVALWCVLLLDPLSVLSISFWLSFISVGLIILSVRKGGVAKNIWWKLSRIQLVMAIGLIPLTIILFQQYSLVAFFANSFAVPWMGFVILPLILLGLMGLIFSAKMASIFFWLANKCLIFLWWVLAKFSSIPFAVITYVPFSTFSPDVGQFKLTVLDVGQGLATVIQTHKHILVFDAGPRFGLNYDMGESVVTPFLQTLNAKKIDLLVISHGDNDHAGGASAIVKNFSVTTIESGEPGRLKLSRAILPCKRYEKWQWDKINFEFLFPEKNSLQKGNDHSCVLKITTANQKSILLTGDIEKQAEKFLLDSKENLAADILVAPHHGSKTSGLNEFVAAVHPHWVVFSVGYLNRYHFPNAFVVKKYQAIGTKILATDRTGAMQFLVGDKNITVESYRVTHRRFWNEESIKKQYLSS